MPAIERSIIAAPRGRRFRHGLNTTQDGKQRHTNTAPRPCAHVEHSATPAYDLQRHISPHKSSANPVNVEGLSRGFVGHGRDSVSQQSSTAEGRAARGISFHARALQGTRQGIPHYGIAAS